MGPLRLIVSFPNGSYSLKNISVFLISASLVFAAQLSHAGEWFADEATGCQAWNGAPRPGETIAWRGACEGGKIAGTGTLQFFQTGIPGSESTITCEFRNGKCNGVGTVTWANGNRREGTYVDGVSERKGVFIWADGARYEGDFINGRRTGKGTIIWPNGNRYQGDFVDGKRTGKGAFTWLDGKREEGNYVQDNHLGRFLVTWTDGTRYEREYTGDESDLEQDKIVNSCTPVTPVYPPSALPSKNGGSEHTGTVIARALVVNGAVQAVQVLSGPSIFYDAVRGAVAQYTCPVIKTPVEFVAQFNFVLH